jgi:hypothetical protein
MAVRKKLSARKAAWLAFGLVTLSTVSSYAQDTLPKDADAELSNVSDIILDCSSIDAERL